ncbi:MAG: hypothetical protein U0350_47535 [Caldilineaceae bacterium]
MAALEQAAPLSLPALLQKQGQDWQTLVDGAKTLVSELLQEVKTTVTTFDERYQHFVQSYVNPLLIDRTRRAIGTVGRRSPAGDKRAGKGDQPAHWHWHRRRDHRGHCPFDRPTTSALGNRDGVLSHPTALSDLLADCGKGTPPECRPSVGTLLHGQWLGSYYTVGAIGVILLGLAQKVMVICENTLRTNRDTIFGQQPHQVWVLMDWQLAFYGK